MLKTWRRFALTFLGRPERISYALLALSLLALIITSSSISSFGLAAIVEPLGLIVQNAVPVILLAFGAGLAVSAGQIDVSTAALAGLSAILYAIWTQWVQISGGPALAILAVIGLIPIFHGLIMGYIVSSRKGPSLIVSWSLGVVYTVIAGIITFHVTNPEYVSTPLLGNATSISFAPPQKQTQWLQLWDGGWKLATWISTCYILIRISQIDRIARAIGASRRNSRYIGVDEGRSLRFIFFLAAAFSSLAGILQGGFSNSASVGDNAGLELTAVAVAVLGGTVLSGGYFSATGIIAAGLVYQTLVYLTGSFHIEELKYIEPRLIQVLFSLVLLAVSALFGKLLSGDTEVIVIRSKDL